MKNTTKNAVLLAVAKTIKGTSFVGIRNYENKQGEVSNQTIIAGITWENCLVNDFQALETNKYKIFKDLTDKYSADVILKAYEELYKSLETRLASDEVKEELRKQNNPTLIHSDAQKDAYTFLAKGVKENNESGQIHIFGLVVKKTILQPIEYKKVNSRELTLCKNEIQKICEFKQTKYRNFVFDKAELKMQGVTFAK